MKLRPDQLAAAIGKSLLPVYAVCGDEPLLVDEATTTVREAVRAQGFDEREMAQAETGFNWGTWLSGFDSLSLFASRRLVELRIPTGKPGVEGGKTLEAWASNPPADTVLLLILPRIDRAGQASKWFTALDRAGAVVTITPPTVEQLPAWMGERLARKGLKADRETLAWLGQRIEGNLLAAHQEIEKLALLLPAGPIRLDQVREAVHDVARYDASDLPEALLNGDATRYCRIIDGLEAEGEAPPLAVWMVAQELRTLYQISQGLAQGEAMLALMRRLKVWDSRQPLLTRAVRRFANDRLRRGLQLAARADRAAKGLLREDAWAMLKTLGLGLMGQPAPGFAETWT